MVNANKIYRLIEEKASVEEVREAYKEYVKKTSNMEEFRKVRSEVWKYIGYSEEEKKENDDKKENNQIVDENYIKVAVDSFGQEGKIQRKEREYNEKIQSIPIIYDETGSLDLNGFQRERQEDNSYSDGGRYVVTKKSILGRIKENLKELIQNTSDRVKKNVKKGTVVVLSVLLAATVTGAASYDNGKDAGIDEATNNIIAVYEVQEGENLNKLEDEFYKLDIVERALDGFELAEYESKNGKDSLLEGDKLLVLTNEETFEEKGDAIKLASPDSIEKYYYQNKLFDTKKAVSNWMSGKSPIDYITGNSKSY